MQKEYQVEKPQDKATLDSDQETNVSQSIRVSQKSIGGKINISSAPKSSRQNLNATN